MIHRWCHAPCMVTSLDPAKSIGRVCSDYLILAAPYARVRLPSGGQAAPDNEVVKLSAPFAGAWCRVRRWRCWRIARRKGRSLPPAR
jgi:hypothetical protein